jgi:DNA-binding HxlR family transcriptional regulator
VSKTTPGVSQMSAPLTLSAEFRKIVEARMNQVLKGVEVTFNQIIETQKITPSELKKELDSLQESFNLLFQKWSLEILYTLLLKDSMGFSGIKKILTVNSRTLSDKLKILQKHGYITREVSSGPPLRVEYVLTAEGKNTVLLALPLLYYTSSVEVKD